MFVLWRAEFHRIKDEWCGVDEVFNRQDILEERHRIDVDCRRTDRTQPLFITHTPTSSPENEEAAKAQYYSSFSPNLSDHGAQAPSNEHIERMAGILLTYNFYEKHLGKFSDGL